MLGSKQTRIEELQATIRQQADRIAEFEHDVADLGNAAKVAARAMDKTDAAELAGWKAQAAAKDREIEVLRKRLAERDGDIVRLVGERDTAFSVLELMSKAPEWTPEDTPDLLTQLRRERSARRALDLRLQFMQAASEAADAHRGTAPWVGEQQRAEAAS
jgi:chromosome segregation ATPase